MEMLPDLLIKQEEIVEEDSYFNLGFDIKVKVEDASPDTVEETDWCVDNRDLFNNNSYVNAYDEFIEYSKQECRICHKKFDDLYTLCQHNLIHVKVMLNSCRNHPYQCKYCNTYFLTKDKLNTHQEQCNQSNINVKVTKEFQCYECGKVMPYKSWHSHVRQVHNSDKARCKICNKEFKCYPYLRKHIMYKHEGREPCWKVNSDVKCQLCSAVLRNKHALKTHMNNCHSDSEFTCGMCQATFKSKPYLRTHIDRVHDRDGNKYNCVCGKSYSSPRRLKRHKQRSGCEDI